MQFYWLMLGTLAVWRVTHLLHVEDGPWMVFARLRQVVAKGPLKKLWDCFYCLSLWVAAPCAAWIAPHWNEGILLWLSLSAGAILLERTTSGPVSPPAIYYEDKEEQHVMLRSTENTRSTES